MKTSTAFIVIATLINLTSCGSNSAPQTAPPTARPAVAHGNSTDSGGFLEGLRQTEDLIGAAHRAVTKGRQLINELSH